MVQTRWQVRFTCAGAVTPAEPIPFVADLPADWEGWIAGEGLAIGTPFLISPTYEFDVVLNGYFLQASMVGATGKTREAHARDIAAFCRSSGSPGMRSVGGTLPKLIIWLTWGGGAGIRWGRECLVRRGIERWPR